ncbi:MAG: class I SAM-dependent methyltransferase [Planctomycetes bacterium]|nr:class I SAM-dependent methyltransferase [Planctomycetota bacterium]
MELTFKLKKLFNKFFLNQHPEAALRYFPVVSAIKKAKLRDSKILEVGSGSLGITPYLKKSVDGVDIDFSGPRTDLVNRIKGSVEKLPFKKSQYDVVIAVDVLEHLHKNIRPLAISEILRVCRKLAIIVVPVGKLSETQDRQLDQLWKRIFRTQNQFLAEHVANGLPSIDEILVTIDKSARKLNKNAKVSSFPNLNLSVRNILMRTWISKNHYVYYTYMKGYLLLLPILRFANFGNCYRRVFVIELAPR